MLDDQNEPWTYLMALLQIISIQVKSIYEKGKKKGTSQNKALYVLHARPAGIKELDNEKYPFGF